MVGDIGVWLGKNMGSIYICVCISYLNCVFMCESVCIHTTHFYENFINLVLGKNLLLLVVPQNLKSILWLSLIIIILRSGG